MTELKQLTPQDVSSFEQLIDIFREVFEHDSPMPPTDYLTNLLQKPDFKVFVAMQGATVIGGLTVHLLHSYYAQEQIAYIYDVGVHPAHQRQGVGKQLIAYLTDYCRANQIEEAYVEAETDDLQAVSFYQKTPYNNIMHATHFTYFC